MSNPEAKFNGLADSYERTRPRYPVTLFEHAVTLLPRTGRPAVVDAGAGTGIALEALLPLLPADAIVHAVDISDDMIRIGRDKFPQVAWYQGTAEAYLGSLSSVDLVVAAQAYQWMDRPAYVDSVARCLSPGGVCMVVQNNRNHGIAGFAADYEDLLEKLSPGYSRSYRAIDVAEELGARFGRVEQRVTEWHQRLTIEDFSTMSSSSTQAQRAIAAVGPLFLDRVRELCERYADAGHVNVPYIAEAFYGIASR
ncbi:methyltransferase domain-containing protein [Nonomuraea fuscirosea]|uniref:class I SAM-dependent methyltransferase n=1 Tax=Nonomuraea fuscirosea TaxID=1291556 RepID=UPI003440C3DF